MEIILAQHYRSGEAHATLSIEPFSVHVPLDSRTLPWDDCFHKYVGILFLDKFKWMWDSISNPWDFIFSIVVAEVTEIRCSVESEHMSDNT